VLVPAVSSALERKDVRLLYVLDSDFSYSAGAIWADTRLWARHIKDWRKVAVVSDADWLENSIKAFGRMIPGDIKLSEPDEILETKQWLVDLDDEDDD
jgi:hypothetical protein